MSLVATVSKDIKGLFTSTPISDVFKDIKGLFRPTPISDIFKDIKEGFFTSTPISEQPSVTNPSFPEPEELLVEIFRNLDPLERSAPALVSTVWNRVVKEPSLWPKTLDELKCNVIDEPVYKQHALKLIEQGNLTFEGTQPIDQNDIVAIMRVTKFYARLQAAGTSIEGNLGVTILTIPKGLSINLVQAVFRDRIYFFWDIFLREFGDAKVDKTYQVIIANNVLEGTRSKSFEEHKALVGKAWCILPKVLEAMTLALLTEKSAPTQTRLFGDNPRTYTRCIDVNGRMPLVVGGFDHTGLSARHSDLFSILFDDVRYDTNAYGAACLQKFQAKI